MNKILFSSNRMDWETPQDFFDKLNKEFNFTLDVCATPENKKCDQYISEGMDGLKQKWCKINWCNPPYGNSLKLWIEKAYNEAKLGNTTVMLMPARTDTKYFHKFILPFSGLNCQSNDIVWATGIVDGEGCIRIHKINCTKSNKLKNPNYSLRIQVRMTCEETINKLKKIFNCGSINLEKRGRNKNCYIWRIDGDKAREILIKIYPYSITKKQEIFSAIEFSNINKTKKGHKVNKNDLKIKEYYFNLLKELKKNLKIKLINTEIRFIKGRLKFKGKNKKGEWVNNSATFPSAVIVFRPKK